VTTPRNRPSGKDRQRQVISLLIRDGLDCHWCGKRFTQANRPTLDHVEEWAKGGANTQSNLVLAHTKCNNERSNPRRAS
jgi:5-methylcytosine-specific restriction endonuclease McrA